MVVPLEADWVLSEGDDDAEEAAEGHAEKQNKIYEQQFYGSEIETNNYSTMVRVNIEKQIHLIKMYKNCTC